MKTDIVFLYDFRYSKNQINKIAECYKNLIFINILYIVSLILVV